MILSKEGRELLQKATKDSVPEFSLEGQKLLAKVVGVYDADTCRVVFFLHDRPVRFSVRLTGIDTPEMRPSRNKPNRDLEKKLAVRARNRLIQLVTSVEINLDDNWRRNRVQGLIDRDNDKLVVLECGEFDKYGRLLGRLFQEPVGGSSSKNSDNNSVNDTLIKEGVARVYHGGTKSRQPWS